MAKVSYPSAKQDQFVVRFPEGLRDRVKAAAEVNSRSMNSEIIATLEQAYPDDDASLLQAIRVIEDRLEEGPDSKNPALLALLRRLSQKSARIWFEPPEDDDK